MYSLYRDPSGKGKLDFNDLTSSMLKTKKKSTTIDVDNGIEVCKQLVHASILLTGSTHAPALQIIVDQ